MHRLFAGSVLALALAGCSAGSATGTPTADPSAARTAGSPSAAAPAPSPGGTARAMLTVATDGCGVIRTDVGDLRGLQWSIRDAEGFQVLARNAENETRYRYFRPGRYSVVLEAFLDGGYTAVSNTVEISCG